MKLKRYLLFGCDTYYPAGGWSDFVGSFDTVEEARAEQSRDKFDWYDLVDIETGEELKFYGGSTP